MASLTGQSIKSSYPLLLKIDSTGVDTTLRAVEDGDATDSCLYLATNKAMISGSGVKLYFSDEGGEYISGNNTDLTIGSGADINLTATTDINIPANVGLTFGDDGEKIEGNGTDLTISGNKINLNPTADVHLTSGTGMVIGHTAQETVSTGDGSTDLVPEFQILGTNTATSSMLLACFSTTASTAATASIGFVKGGNGSIGSHTIVTDDEYLGYIRAYGDVGADLESVAAEIAFASDGTPGTGDMPGRIEFSTSSDGSQSATERMQIDSAGDTTLATGNLIITGATKGIIHTNSGTVTQGTSITTTVVLNTTSGIITMHATAIAADENIEFTVTNSTVQTDSVILLTMQDENTVDNTQLVCATHTIGSGSFKITVANTDSGQASSGTAVKIHFLIINNS